ncbi:uncharacterized protein LOC119674355 [Teleopsis dalmanni]|uniref:uncharacterized protein LOC119674355 n=1 Tax=Teleopsis dalmanni TaxID=139649 RepID=UPI000D32A772|nr:uncharacterized protein LOC119674355 [Teleopsis dalmanni]
MADLKKYFNPNTQAGKATIAGTAVVTAVTLTYLCYRMFRTCPSNDCPCCTAERAASLYAPQPPTPTTEKPIIPHDPHKQKSAVFAKPHGHSESGSSGSHEPTYEKDERDEPRRPVRRSREYDDYEPRRDPRDYSRERYSYDRRYSEPPSGDRYGGSGERSHSSCRHENFCPNCGYSYHNEKPSCNHFSHNNNCNSCGGNSQNSRSHCPHESSSCGRQSNTCSSCSSNERRSPSCGSTCSHEKRSQNCGSNYSQGSHSQSNRCQRSHNNERRVSERSSCSHVSHDSRKKSGCNSYNTEPVSNKHRDQKSPCKNKEQTDVEDPEGLDFCQKKQREFEMENGTKTSKHKKDQRNIEGEHLLRNAGAAMGAP